MGDGTTVESAGAQSNSLVTGAKPAAVVLSSADDEKGARRQVSSTPGIEGALLGVVGVLRPPASKKRQGVQTEKHQGRR
jgi:hypothetical protein